MKKLRNSLLRRLHLLVECTDRPSIVADKERIGDWEIDTIIGKQRKQAMVTIVERVSKKTVLKKVKAKSAELVTKATIDGLSQFSNLIFTITGDNGTEFANHKKLVSGINDDDLSIIMDKLNNRPRKSLGYAAPNEVFR